MSLKHILIGAAALVGVCRLGETLGYTRCMTDILNDHGDKFPNETLTLKYPYKKGLTVSVSKFKKES